ncbi:MAG: pirin family protein [Chromatiales bacterium]
MQHNQQARKIQRIIHGMPTSDGAGVELTRIIGQPALMDFDPFLLLDAFRSDRPEDYIAGFPPHPHRGFETVTYLLNGKMRHRDNAGHEGVIEAGGIQWMTAGKGIIHSEMPEQENGLLEGFQLWINLPATNKMDHPAYQEFAAAEIPLEQRNGAQIRVISGITSQNTSGPVNQPLTEPLYLDVILAPQADFQEPLPAQHNAFVYQVHGQLRAENTAGQQLTLQADDLALLDAGDWLQVSNPGQQQARFLLVAGKPLHEPIARGGPFVMNHQHEINQAFDDYRNGRL